ncbi:MAG: SOS response-associated peptidase [Gammaproteobacteria bacterium]
MCGRYALSITASRLGEFFASPAADADSGYSPSYNIAPGRDIWGCSELDGERRLDRFSWGLIPPWARVPETGSRLINARSETVASKPAFRGAFQKRRCLIAADAFYEWRKAADGKQPYCIAMQDREPFAIAALWGTWVDVAGGRLRSCALLTTGANGLMEDIHPRMPVILNETDWDLWLSPDVRADDLKTLLKPYPEDAMQAWPVDTAVNIRVDPLILPSSCSL